MTQLFPGGCRASGLRKMIFNPKEIAAACARNKIPARNCKNSIAQGNRHGGPHKHEREIARRRRQQEHTQ